MRGLHDDTTSGFQCPKMGDEACLCTCVCVMVKRYVSG